MTKFHPKASSFQEQNKVDKYHETFGCFGFCVKAGRAGVKTGHVQHCHSAGQLLWGFMLPVGSVGFCTWAGSPCDFKWNPVQIENDASEKIAPRNSNWQQTNFLTWQCNCRWTVGENWAEATICQFEKKLFFSRAWVHDMMATFVTSAPIYSLFPLHSFGCLEI